MTNNIRKLCFGDDNKPSKSTKSYQIKIQKNKKNLQIIDEKINTTLR